MTDMAPSPCPFCGGQLVPHPKGGGWGHPKNDCLLAVGFKLLPHMVEAWNRRALSYSVVDGYPVFNHTGEGRSVDADFLNATFDYIRKQRT